MTDGVPTLSLDLSTPDPVPAAGIERALELMRSGRLFRYGEDRSAGREVARLEGEVATLLGRRYGIGVNSGGSAIFVALKAIGIGPGDRVLLNGFTLAPVPGAIVHAGARPVLVECTEDLTIDLEDLERRLREGASAVLVSHMRGHVADMDAVATLCQRFDAPLVEDCAHTLGATWNGRQTGTFGVAGAFSDQTFKHVNGGEGGFLVTDDEALAAAAILYSGSYMFYGQHTARPPLEAFEPLRELIPNFSLRMSELAAAVVRPQIALVAERARGWNERYAWLVAELSAIPGIRLPRRDPREGFVGSSLQFFVDGQDGGRMERFVRTCDEHGLHVKWFGAPEPIGFTSTYEHWGYLEAALPRTRAILARLCDLRVPLALTRDDCTTIGSIVRHARETAGQPIATKRA